MQKRETAVENRLRTLRVMWLAMLSNVVIFFLISVFAFNAPSESSANVTLTIALLVLGTLFVVISFPLKQRVHKLAVEQQKIDLVQTGFVLAWAVCEVAALLGMLDRFLSNDRYYFVLFLISAAGMAMHFPRRDHLLAATYKTSSKGSAF